MGLLKFTRAWKIAIDIMNSLLKRNKIIHMTDLLQLLVESKINIKPLPYDKTWGEFDLQQI